MTALRPLLFALLLPAAFLPMLEARLVFEDKQVEIEAALTDTEAEVVFPFRNEGDETVKILRLSSSCGCTVPRLEKREYAPGDSGEIRARFDFGKRTGTQHKRVSVQTDEVPQGMHTLTFKTEIPVWATVQPQLLRWPLDAPGSGKSLTLRINHPDQVQLKAWSTDLEAFLVDKVEKENGLVEFVITPTDTSARVTERFEVELSLGEEDGAPTRQLVSYCLIR